MKEIPEMAKSGILINPIDCFPGMILDLVLAGSFQLALDERIFDEYAKVLKNPPAFLDFTPKRNH